MILGPLHISTSPPVLRAYAGVLWAAFGGGLLAMPGQGGRPETGCQEGKAVVRAVRGAATYKIPGGNPWKKLAPNYILKPGATIRTGDDSSVDLYLPAHVSLVRLTAHGVLALDKLQSAPMAVAETVLDLKAGTLLGNVRTQTADSRFEVKYPVGVYRLRGTAFKLSQSGACFVGNGTATLTHAPPGKPVRTVTLKNGGTFNPLAERIFAPRDRDRKLPPGAP